MAAISAVASPPEAAAVRQQVEQFCAAMIEPDAIVLEALTMPDLTYGHSGGRIENQTEFITGLVQGRPDFLAIELSDQRVHVSGDVAVVRHALAAQTRKGGATNDINISVLLVWVKRGERWILLARQATILPPDQNAL